MAPELRRNRSRGMGSGPKKANTAAAPRLPAASAQHGDRELQAAVEDRGYSGAFPRP